MKLSLFHKISFGIIILVMGLVGALSVVGNRIVTQSMEEKVRKDLQEASRVFEYSRRVLSQELTKYVQLVASLSDLSGLSNNEDFNHAQALAATKSLQEKINSDLFLVTDPKGRLLASVSEPTLHGTDLKQEPIIDQALKGKINEGYWLREQQIYQIIASPLKENGSISGTLLIGFSLKDLLKKTLPNMTNAKVALVIGKTVIRLEGEEYFQTISQEIESGSLEENKIVLKTIGDERLLIAYIPLGAGNFYILVRSLDEELIFFHNLQKVLLAMTCIILLLALAVGLIFSKQLTRPIEELEEGVGKIAMGDLSAQIKVHSSDEIGSLANSFNNMAKNLEKTTEELTNAEKMKTVGQLSAGVVHEVKHPLATIKSQTEYLAEKYLPPNEKAQKAIQRMETAIEQADTVIKGLLDLSTVTELKLEETDLNVIVEKTLALVKNECDRNQIRTTKNLSTDMIPMKLDPYKIQQVIVNLVLNSVKAIGKDGEIVITTSMEKQDNKDVACIVIEDTGPGISPEIKDKLFDPFFTTNRDSGGTGLGLTIIKNIVNLHKGIITMKNRKEKGAQTTIFLPKEPAV